MQALHNFVSHALPSHGGSHEAKPAQVAEAPGTNSGLPEPVLKESTAWEGGTKTLQDHPQPVNMSADLGLATNNVTGTREEVVPHEPVAEAGTEAKEDMAIKGQEEMTLSNSVGKEGVQSEAVRGPELATVNEKGSGEPHKDGKTEGLGFLGGLVVKTFQPLATVVGEGASVLMGGSDDGAAKREAAHLEATEALENVNSPTTPHGTPLLERLVQLEEQMSTLEDKYTPRGLAEGMHSPASPTTPSSLEKRSRPARSVLLEAESKGTLMERVQLLEMRISQHSMDLEKAFPSGQFSSNLFDPKHPESPYSQEAPKLAEPPRPEILETGTVTSKGVLPPAPVKTATPGPLHTEMSMTGLQEHDLAPLPDASIPLIGTKTGTTESMPSSEGGSAKPPLVYELSTQVPATGKDSIFDSATPLGAATKQEPVMQDSLEGFAVGKQLDAIPIVQETKPVVEAVPPPSDVVVGKQLDEPLKESIPIIQEKKPVVDVVPPPSGIAMRKQLDEPLKESIPIVQEKKPLVEVVPPPSGIAMGKQRDEPVKESVAKVQEKTSFVRAVPPPSVPVTPTPPSDPYSSAPQPIVTQGKKQKMKNFTQRCVQIFKKKHDS